MDTMQSSNEELSRLFTNHSRSIMEELVQGKLYTRFGEKEDTRILTEYIEILQECINRKLDQGVYEECLLMCQGILSNIERLPNHRNWMAWSDWIPYLDRKLPTMRNVFEGNMNYLAMMWYENQESLDRTVPLEMLESPYFDGRPLANQSKSLFACMHTFESGDYWVKMGHEFVMVAKKPSK